MDIKKFFINKIDSSPTIIEAGTSTGYDTLEFSQLFPNGKIYGFEPILELYNEAKEKLKNQNNVFLFNKALSTKSGIEDIYVSEYFNKKSESSSLLKPKDHITYHPNVKFNDVIKVETISLDDFIEFNKIKKIDLMWLDLQGYEPSVLKSSPNTLSITKYIYSEVLNIDLYENAVKNVDFDNLMISLGFSKIWSDLDLVTGKIDAYNSLFENNNF